MTRAGVGWVVLLATAATPAFAATICVNPKAVAGCHATIQEAVDAAAAGDRIAVQAGTYYENVLVPPGKDGLQISGANTLGTVLDPDVPNTGAGVEIRSNRVSLRNLTIRNGRTYGIVIAANQAVVQGLRIVGARGEAGIFAVAGATGLGVLSCEIRSIRGAGIRLEGGNVDSTLKGNVIAQTSGDGIVASAARLTVASNRIFSVGGKGVSARSDQGTAFANLVENTVDVGVLLEGSGAVLDSNRAVATPQGFAYTCLGCQGARVQRNSSVGARGMGFVIDSQPGGAPDLLVQLNSATDSRVSAFLLTGTAMQASANQASATAIGAGFAISGEDHTLSRNTALRSTGAGFEVAADRVRLDQNVATAGNANGFLVVGTNGPSPSHADNVLTGNRASGTNGQGFGVVSGAQHTVFAGNAASKDRLDFCDEGANTDTSATNAFTTRSARCAVMF